MSIFYGPFIVIAIAYATVGLAGLSQLPVRSIYLLVLNVIALLAFGWDKLMAIFVANGMKILDGLHLRIPNWVLFWLLGGLGGGFGAFLGIPLWNHKRSEKYKGYRGGLFTIMLLQAAVLFAAITWYPEGLDLVDGLIARTTTLIVQAVNYLIGAIQVAIRELRASW